MTPSQWIVNPLAASSRAALRTARSSGYSISRSLILAMRRRARPFRWNSLPHGWWPSIRRAARNQLIAGN